jgi:hypothetical protein
MTTSVLVERLADGADPAVHHVGRRDDVGAGRGVRERRPGQVGERAVVVDLDEAGRIGPQRAAVPVLGVLAEADVGPQRQGRQLPAERGQRARHRAGRIPGGRPLGVLAVRQAEQDDARHAGGLQVAALLHDHVHAHLRALRHGRDVAPDAFAAAHEQRGDEIVGAEARLADEAPHRVGAAQAPRAMDRK